MKRIFIFILIMIGIVISSVGCGGDSSVNATIDVASSVNFRCEVDMTTEENAFTLGEDDASYLFQSCFEYKNKAKKIKGSEITVTTDYIKINFVGDCVDNAPIIDGKADYSGFNIFSNNVVRFEYDGKSEYYQFEDGFYNFINTYLLIFADR